MVVLGPGYICLLLMGLCRGNVVFGILLLLKTWTRGKTVMVSEIATDDKVDWGNDLL